MSNWPGKVAKVAKIANFCGIYRLADLEHRAYMKFVLSQRSSYASDSNVRGAMVPYDDTVALRTFV